MVIFDDSSISFMNPDSFNIFDEFNIKYVFDALVAPEAEESN
jgi:hypothetical protein